MNPTHWLISTQVLRPCRKPGAHARGFKWFDGQGGASVASENAALGNLSAWRAAHAAKLIVLERQGLAKLVSDRLKHLSSQRGVDAVPTHCRDASCAARVSAQRVTLDAGALETQLDAGVRRFSALLNWARAAAAFDESCTSRTATSSPILNGSCVARTGSSASTRRGRRTRPS